MFKGNIGVRSFMYQALLQIEQKTIFKWYVSKFDDIAKWDETSFPHISVIHYYGDHHFRPIWFLDDSFGTT